MTSAYSIELRLPQPFRLRRFAASGNKTDSYGTATITPREAHRWSNAAAQWAYFSPRERRLGLGHESFANHFERIMDMIADPQRAAEVGGGDPRRSKSPLGLPMITHFQIRTDARRTGRVIADRHLQHLSLRTRRTWPARLQTIFEIVDAAGNSMPLFRPPTLPGAPSEETGQDGRLSRRRCIQPACFDP